MHRQRRDSSLFHLPKDVTQPSGEVLLDRQTSRGSKAEAGTTSVHSDQALHHSSNRSTHSCERLPSGLLKDFTVGGEETASNRAHLSDDISGSNDSPDSCNLSDKHERTTALLPSVRALTDTADYVPFGSDDEHEPSPLVTLTGPRRNLSPDCSIPTRAKNSPGEQTDPRGLAHQPPVMEDGRRGLSYLMPETTAGKEGEDVK